MARICQSLLQTTFGSTLGGLQGGNFEAVILEGNSLNHWWRDNSQFPYQWKRGQVVVSDEVAGPASIIQSDFKSGDHGNFEVVVPLRASNGLMELWHFWHDNSDASLPLSQE